MKQYTPEELEKKINDMRDTIEKYLELSQLSYLEFDNSRVDILRAGLKELNDDLYFLTVECFVCM